MRDVVKENPANKVEEIIVGEYEPQIPTVDQSREFMEITWEHDLELLTPAALNLFCGIPSIRDQTVGVEEHLD